MHQSENSTPLKINNISLDIRNVKLNSESVELVILPFIETLAIFDTEKLIAELNDFISGADKNATIAILTSPLFACEFSSQLQNNVHLKLWIAIKLEEAKQKEGYLKQNHGALLILTNYHGSLKHTKTRIGYKYCPTCKKTTKDYGGKKHLYHEFGTLISDVWQDVTLNFNNYPHQIINRISDLFGLPNYKYLNVYDMRFSIKENSHPTIFQTQKNSKNTNNSSFNSELILGNCIEKLKIIPDNSIDFCFADPPYNLNKKYENWDDSIDIKGYFTWCDTWLSELERVLKPGRTLAVLNIPQWCIRHFKHLNKTLKYQDWIVWEGLSMPVRMIMPSHYSILCFTKGEPRLLPCLSNPTPIQLEKISLETQFEDFCIRSSCISYRKKRNLNDKKEITNLWFDIHRLKHNSKRVDHPCQLPPMLMYRLISLFTNQNEIVLDPFNGVGTTTLCAQQLNRRFIGIELSEYYHNKALQRHEDIRLNLDPFRKNSDLNEKVKNSRVKRITKQKYKVSKKTLQLEIKQISKKIGHIPTKIEVIEYSKFPIEYYENYFINWAEATAAARTTGMSELQKEKISELTDQNIQFHLFDSSSN